MKYIIITVFIALSGSFFCQDTIFPIFSGIGKELKIDSTFYKIELFNEQTKKWEINHYSDSKIQVIEFLAEDKFHPIDSTIGFYKNGEIAFIKNYKYNGIYSNLHGVKKTFYLNGKLSTNGFFYNGIKSGKWSFYDSLGHLNKTTEFRIKEIDTLLNLMKLNSQIIKYDTVKILTQYDESTSYIDLGKNGFEIVYKNNVPQTLNIYINNQIVLTEKRKRKIKRLLTTAQAPAQDLTSLNR